jgi:putative NIF3 family GTP cyclohydrolase 1 type 2
MKAQEIVDTILEYSAVPFRLERTCDNYISGDPDTEVTGVVTTFMANVDVIREAVHLGANMIVTHEPTYFTGWDTTDWLEDDPIYLAKKKMIDDNNIVIWRYHDHMHMKKPDGIYEGLNKELDWEDKLQKGGLPPDADRPAHFDNFADAFGDVYVIPETTLSGLADFFKEKFAMDVVQIIGDPDMKCTRVGILVGGGSLGLGKEEMPMQVMEKHDIDVLVCGEITEWTLCAYVNDAYKLGFNRALLILGHERTEEWGMKYMAEWLGKLIPGVPVTFVDAKEPFKYL